MPKYCENEACENEAVEVVPVSLDANTVQFRHLCYPCSEAYSTGVQHGRFRAARQLRAYAESLREQGLATEAGVIFCAVARLDVLTDPGEDDVGVPTLGDDDDRDDADYEISHCEGDHTR